MTASVNIQSEKASILLIYTGGTIGMIENPETGVLESFNFQHLKDNMPELKKLGYAVSTIQFVWEEDVMYMRGVHNGENSFLVKMMF